MTSHIFAFNYHVAIFHPPFSPKTVPPDEGVQFVAIFIVEICGFVISAENIHELQIISF